MAFDFNNKLIDVTTISDVSPQSLGLVPAKNIIEFVISEEYLGVKTIWPFQYQTLVQFHELACPYCNSNLERLIDVQKNLDWLLTLHLFENGICPNCGKTRIDAYKDGHLKLYNELVGAAGIKAGKSTMAAAMEAPYQFHKYLCSPHFREWVGIMPWVKLQLIFVATTQSQTKRTGWDYFSKSVEYSPWFKNYFNAVDKYARDHKVHKDTYYIKNSTSLDIKWQNLEAVSWNSNAFGAAGGTFVFVFIDEMSRFNRGESQRSVEEIYRVTKNNLIPVRESVANAIENGKYIDNGDFLDGIETIMSSPMEEDDKILNLVEGAKSIRRRFAFHQSSFNVNPNLNRERIVEGEDESDADYISRDMEALPARSGTPYITNIESIKRQCVHSDSPMKWHLEEVDAGYVGQRRNIRIKLVLDYCNNDRMMQYFAHCDPGHVRDSFGIVLAKAIPLNGLYRTQVFEVIDIAQPPHKMKNVFYEVDFESVIVFFKGLYAHILMGGVSYDRWQSVAHIQALRNLGLYVDQISSKYEMYLNWAQDLNSRQIDLPIPEVGDWDKKQLNSLPPKSKMLKEVYMLRDFGGKIDHPSTGSSDLAVPCISVHKLIQQKLGNLKGVPGQKNQKVFGRPYGIMKPHIVRLNSFR